MFVAWDSNENRIYADEFDGKSECFCPCCGESLRLRKGNIRRPHFAHKGNTDCLYGADKDYKSEWHIRMQEYFPKETREYRFKDLETGEIHIADVFIESSNTIIEFQHSPIQAEEYLSRTIFHLNNGRRIVWIFDESKDNQNDDRGRFRADDYMCMKYPHTNLQYRWMRQPRKFLASKPDLLKYGKDYSVCVWTGDAGDVLHRIIAEAHGFEYVCFSFHNIIMNDNIDADDFFRTEAEGLEYPQHIVIKKVLEAIQQKNRDNLIRYHSPVVLNGRGRTRL